jgi:hypothetical protein
MPKYLQPANRRGGSISQRLLAKTWQFPSLFPEGPHFCSHLLTVKGAVKNFFDAQRLFSYFYSFQPYHFLPDSNWCDSPFKGKAGRSRRDNRQSTNTEILRIFFSLLRFAYWCTNQIRSADYSADKDRTVTEQSTYILIL